MSALIFPSLQTFFDTAGRPLRGAKAYFYQPGTTNPLTVYKSALSDIAHAQPVEASSYGRFPVVFCNQMTVRVRVTSALGELIEEIDNLPATAIETVSVGGTYDPNGLMIAGDVLWNLRSVPRAGFVRANGLSISSALGSGTERANTDVAALYAFLWNNVASLAVSGGRGANSTADFNANKTLDLPDLRGRGLFGVASMGTVASGRLDNGLLASGAVDTVGSVGGEAVHTLTIAQMPSHTHSVNKSLTSFAGSGLQFPLIFGSTASTTTTAATGGDGAHNTLPPFMLGTWYLKL